MADTAASEPATQAVAVNRRPTVSALELCLTCNPPILESLLLQIPTHSILALYHTSAYLRHFLRAYPTSWKYLSFRLYQPVVINGPGSNNSVTTGPRQSSNYALDQLLIYIVNPFSTCLTSLELDNTAVSGQILTQTVLHLRRDTLTHLSVRGCKNVSLKYHINPWLTLFGLVTDVADGAYAPKEFQTLALKSLYVYRCRHHRRRPYLPSSLVRKDSDSEPTHELVNICHRLGIWTDTAWCTTPGTRCYRRRGYVTMRVPQDPREVWVVYDRLWRSRNWLGPTEPVNQATGETSAKKRKRDGRSWEHEENAAYGEALGTRETGKALPAHLRQSHRQFVDDITCDNCAAVILERCEQCSVMMHCSGCRKTLCASCAFDRPYLRNRTAAEEDKNKFWWAPGCAVSPCAMQDQDPSTLLPAGHMGPAVSLVPNLQFKWCCTEPLFSGGGGITYGSVAHGDTDQIRASPLPRGEGWEDAEFKKDVDDAAHAASTNTTPSPGSPVTPTTTTSNSRLGPGGRWPSIDGLFHRHEISDSPTSPHVPRNLCDECYASDTWNVKCKACAMPICLKHDVRDRSRVRICGYKELSVEKQEFRARQKTLKLVAAAVKKAAKGQDAAALPSSTVVLNPENATPQSPGAHPTTLQSTSTTADQPVSGEGTHDQATVGPSTTEPNTLDQPVPAQPDILPQDAPSESDEPVERPQSPRSNSTASPSRSSSPTPSVESDTTLSDPRDAHSPHQPQGEDMSPNWRGCQGFICPQIRPAGDHRRRCTALTRQCQQCKIHICDDCLADMDPHCPCRECRPNLPTIGINTLNPSADPTRFWCPNCRWDRVKTGKCKRRRQNPDTARSRKKDQKRKPLADRNIQSTTSDSTDSACITDERADQFGEFFSALESSTPPGQADSNIEATAEEDIHELQEMGALARDLIGRIQRLRSQFRPGSLPANALPDIRIADGEAEAEAGRGAPELQLLVPVVQDMD